MTPWTLVSLPGSTIHGILQARILEWVAISFPRVPSWSRDQTCISCIGKQILYYQAWVLSPPMKIAKKLEIGSLKQTHNRYGPTKLFHSSTTVPHDNSLESFYRRKQKLTYYCSRKSKEILGRTDKMTFKLTSKSYLKKYRKWHPILPWTVQP